VPENLTPQERAQAIDELRHDLARRQFATIIHSILLDCQYIEALLKMYICAVYKKISDQVGPAIQFKYGEKDLEKATMGKLISIFEKLSDDAILIADLRRVTPIRNTTAHSALLVDFRPEVPMEHLDQTIQELHKDHEATQLAIKRVFEVVGKMIPGTLSQIPTGGDSS
jgi:hypothetical protein